MADYRIEIEPTQIGEILLDDSHILRRPNFDDYVEFYVANSPELLFELNENRDTLLHAAARVGNIHTVELLLATYANFKRRQIAVAWLNFTKSSKRVEEYDGEMNMEDLLGLVKMGNKEGNSVLHEAVYGNNILGLVFKAFEPYNIRHPNGESLAESCYKYALDIVNHARKQISIVHGG